MTRGPLLIVTMTAVLSVPTGAQDRVTTTSHPPLPSHPSLFWLAPEKAGSPSQLARGVALIADEKFAEALPLVTNAQLAGTPLTQYGRFYTGAALLALGRVTEADAIFAALDGRVEGYLKEALPLRMAEAAIARNDPEDAVDILEDLSDDTPLIALEEVLVRLGAALEAAGEPEEALAVYRRVYYEYPMAMQASAAQDAIERLETPARIAPDRFRRELERAEKLFQARRWAQARAGFEPLARVAQKDDQELVALRLAECDYHLGRHRAARDSLRPYLRDSSREAEARFFHLSATRGLGDRATYVTLARGLVADHPTSSWAEETLNNLASHYITVEEDDQADLVFRELVRRFPRSRYSERAAWKIGWEAYKQGDFAQTAAVFEAAAVASPRADYRPAWLYWAARSHDELRQGPAALALYRVAAADYLNSYYGRLAARALAERREPAVRPIVRTAEPGGKPDALPTDALIRALGAAALYDDALQEVEYARRAWGDSPALQATVAWLRHHRGQQDGAADRFADLRGAITVMRRAYPQFLAAGGEALPPDVLRIIFPLDYWPLIKKYSEAHGLDPWLMTALVAQESTFTPDVRSSANAWGLMQLIPGTARRYASKLGIRYSSALLTQPEANVRMGMRYFKDLMDQFGGAHYALASYNAGEHRIARWITERPGFDQQEFIDDIPFPETQNYVKRILGTADDYRRLYGGGVLSTASARR